MSPQNIDNRAIVFIDSGTPDCAAIVQKIAPELRVIIIGLETDGIKEITQILTNSNCQKVYIIALGCPGCLYLGKNELSLNTFIQYTLELQKWFGYAMPQNNNWHHTNHIVYNSHRSSRQSSPPTLAFYGCNVAAGDVGKEFVNKLSQITKAEIAASVNLIDSEIFSRDLSDLN
jgi:hypothetical protein